MAYPLQMFGRVEGNLQLRLARDKQEEEELKKLGFAEAGTGFLRDPSAPKK